MPTPLIHILMEEGAHLFDWKRILLKIIRFHFFSTNSLIIYSKYHIIDLKLNSHLEVANVCVFYSMWYIWNTRYIALVVLLIFAFFFYFQLNRFIINIKFELNISGCIHSTNDALHHSSSCQ